MHAPSKVDVENLDEFVASLGVRISTHGTKQRWNIDVGADDGVQYPFGAEVCNTAEISGERVETIDGDGISWSEAFTGK